MTNAIDAAKAYTNTVRNLQGGMGGESAATPGVVGGPSFGELLKTSAQSAIDAQHVSEKTSAAAVLGKADMTQVLQAVNDAEIALNTVLAVRDRVVQAYNEILRTPI